MVEGWSKKQRYNAGERVRWADDIYEATCDLPRGTCPTDPIVGKLWKRVSLVRLSAKQTASRPGRRDMSYVRKIIGAG